MHRLVFLTLPITLLLVILVLMVLTGTRSMYRDGYPDPFAPYEAIMPEQPSTTLQNYSCSFPNIGSSFLVCIINLPDTAPFSSINIYFYNRTIQQSSFNVNRLYVIDLVWRWGYPDVVQRHTEYFTLDWTSDVHAYVAIAERFGYRLPVLSVTVGSGG